MKIPDSLEEEIEEVMESGKLEELTAVNDKIGVSEYALEMLDEYVYFFRKNFDDDIAKYNREDFVVGLDTANGATSVVAEKVFKALGIKYKIILAAKTSQRPITPMMDFKKSITWKP